MLQPTALLGGGDIRIEPKSRVVEGSRATPEQIIKIVKNLEVVPRQHDRLNSLENDVNAEVISTIATVDNDRAKNSSTLIVKNNHESCTASK